MQNSLAWWFLTNVVLVHAHLHAAALLNKSSVNSMCILDLNTQASYKEGQTLVTVQELLLFNYYFSIMSPKPALAVCRCQEMIQEVVHSL